MHSLEIHLFPILIFRESIQHGESLLLIRIMVPILLQVLENCTRGSRCFYIPMVFAHFSILTLSCNTRSLVGDMISFCWCSASLMAFTDSIFSNGWKMSSAMHNNIRYLALWSFMTSSACQWTSLANVLVEEETSHGMKSMKLVFERRYHWWWTWYLSSTKHKETQIRFILMSWQKCM